MPKEVIRGKSAEFPVNLCDSEGKPFPLNRPHDITVSLQKSDGSFLEKSLKTNGVVVDNDLQGIFSVLLSKIDTQDLPKNEKGLTVKIELLYDNYKEEIEIPEALIVKEK